MESFDKLDYRPEYDNAGRDVPKDEQNLGELALELQGYYSEDHNLDVAVSKAELELLKLRQRAHELRKERENLAAKDEEYKEEQRELEKNLDRVLETMSKLRGDERNPPSREELRLLETAITEINERIDASSDERLLNQAEKLILTQSIQEMNKSIRSELALLDKNIN